MAKRGNIPNKCSKDHFSKTAISRNTHQSSIMHNARRWLVLTMSPDMARSPHARCTPNISACYIGVLASSSAAPHSFRRHAPSFADLNPTPSRRSFSLNHHQNVIVQPRCEDGLRKGTRARFSIKKHGAIRIFDTRSHLRADISRSSECTTHNTRGDKDFSPHRGHTTAFAIQ